MAAEERAASTAVCATAYGKSFNVSRCAAGSILMRSSITCNSCSEKETSSVKLLPPVTAVAGARGGGRNNVRNSVQRRAASIDCEASTGRTAVDLVKRQKNQG